MYNPYNPTCQEEKVWIFYKEIHASLKISTYFKSSKYTLISLISEEPAYMFAVHVTT